MGLPEGKLYMGFSDSMIRWVILTFPRYQCNESGISEGTRKDQEGFRVIKIILLR
jgi:hypothetical protein